MFCFVQTFQVSYDHIVWIREYFSGFMYTIWRTCHFKMTEKKNGLKWKYGCSLRHLVAVMRFCSDLRRCSCEFTQLEIHFYSYSNTTCAI